MKSGFDPDIPDWARKDRVNDMIWIAENIHVLWPAAQEQSAEQGRGAVVVDTTQQPEPDAGHPFGYVTLEQIQEDEDEDVIRLVQQYDPDNELVVVLLKDEGRQSAYRIMIPWRNDDE